MHSYLIYASMHNNIMHYMLLNLQFFCVVIAAYTTEITFARTDSATAASSICYNNPKAQTSSPRICHSLMGVAISSILVCMVLIILDVFIPCVNIQVMITIIIISTSTIVCII